VLGNLPYLAMSRPRPNDLTIIGDWDGFAMPSFPLATLAVCLLGMVYSLVVPGRLREIAKYAVAVLLVAVAFSRLYLGVITPPTSSGPLSATSSPQDVGGTDVEASATSALSFLPRSQLVAYVQDQASPVRDL